MLAISVRTLVVGLKKARAMPRGRRAFVVPLAISEHLRPKVSKNQAVPWRVVKSVVPLAILRTAGRCGLC